MLPPLPRVPEAEGLVEQGGYFVLHAPRQSGKTTFLMALAEALTAGGRYAALYTSCEGAEAAGDDSAMAQRVIVQSMLERANDQLPVELRPPSVVSEGETRLTTFLQAWSEACPRRLVVFFDEIDALHGQCLISVLRQLRAAFPTRPEHAPWSVVLCGLRDVREYKTAAGGDPARLGTASPYNIKAASLALAMFTPKEIAQLLLQHTAETGQPFEPEALDRISTLSGGHPWLVNALANELVHEMKVQGLITVAQVDEAKERLIRAPVAPLETLMACLVEPQVRRVLEPILTGDPTPLDLDFGDDVLYAGDLGLVIDRPLRIANPIYAELIVRVLSNPIQPALLADARSFVRADGRFDLDVLLKEFSRFWVEQGESLVDGVSYREAGPQLVWMAFLHRVVNSRGQISREYAANTRRIDLLLTWPWTDASGNQQIQREALELKVWRDGRKDPLAEGLRQLDGYLDSLGLDTGVLVLFDRRKDALPLENRVREESATSPKGRAIRVLRA